MLAAGAAVTLSGALLAVPGPAAATPGANGALTMAVFGDSPYGTKPSDTAEYNATPAFIGTINADPDVSSVIHVGDIHSGKQFCTQAYDESVAQLWTRFEDPLVYTPGDNEWSDCHKPAEGGGTYNKTTGQIDDNAAATDEYAHGNPLANLELVRSIFFPEPGRTLGGGGLRVQSQADHTDPAHPEDATYVENVRWSRKGVVFVTIDVPGGSNNDADPWYKAPLTAEQTDERLARTAADLRWLDAAFAQADQDGARGVVVITQADMWDLDGGALADHHLTNYDSLVASLGQHTNAYGGPVLLFNGDSHTYRSDNPFSAAAPCETEGTPPSPGAAVPTVPCPSGVADPHSPASVSSTHPAMDVPTFHRVTVHGSTAPLEWLRLTVDPHGGAFGPFSWERVGTGLGS